MIDSQILGETAARCMEELDAQEAIDGGKILAVGIIVVAQNAEGTVSYNRTYTSDHVYYRQLGLFETAIGCVREGRIPPHDGDEEEA